MQHESHIRAASPIPPRTLLIDPTPFGGSNATGELKVSYFRNFGEDALLHLTGGPAGQLRLAKGGVVQGAGGGVAPDAPGIVEECRAFDPQVILYRPVPDPPELHRTAMRLIRELGRPWVIWLMDDWPEHLRGQDEARFARMDRDLREMLRGASKRFVISEGMAEEFGARYGHAFDIFRNGALVEEWASITRRPAADSVRIRYAGSLAPHTTRDSVLEVAKVVSDLAATIPISFEVRSQGMWYRAEKHKYAGLKGVTISAADLSPVDYRQWLADADILLVAYNFDEETARFLRYSFGNKVPEYLASGAAVLAYGPKDLATVKFLQNTNAATIVGEHDLTALRRAIEELAENPPLRSKLGEEGRRFAFSKLDLDRQRTHFIRELRSAAQLEDADLPPAPTPFASKPFSRDEQAQIDECRVVFEAVAWQRPNVMVDVGAHLGSSLARFAGANWTVYAFEPDPKNRERLIKSYGSKPAVLISDEAVSDVAEESVPLYASTESSGISGLKAFRESHREVARVRTTTLNEVVRRHGLTKIDFLKIDVEGFEPAVLRGLDFSRLQPLAVLAEFEDLKSDGAVPASKELAAFLRERGYSVYVSEWYPIARYGARHSFRRVQQYPCEIPPDSWGNLIAFKSNPDPAVLKRAVRSSVDRAIAFDGETEPVPFDPQLYAGSSRLEQPKVIEPASGRGPASSSAASAGAAVKTSAVRGAGGQSPTAASHPPQMRRQVAANWSAWTRPMRRRPVLTVFLSVALASLLAYPLALPLLSTIATPELIVALLAANIALTALVGRVLRKSLISRIENTATNLANQMSQSEARQLSSMKTQLRELESRIVTPRGLALDGDVLAAKIAGQLADRRRAERGAETRNPAAEMVAETELADAHPPPPGEGANGHSDGRAAPTSRRGSEPGGRSANPEPRGDSDQLTSRSDIA